MATLFLDATDYITGTTTAENENKTRVTGTALASGDNVRRLFEIKEIDASHKVVICLKEGTVTNPQWLWKGHQIKTLANAPQNSEGAGLDPDYTEEISFEGEIDS